VKWDNQGTRETWWLCDRASLVQQHKQPTRCNNFSSLILIERINKPKLLVAYIVVDCIWNVMAHVQKPDFVFWRNGQVHLSWQGRQFSRLLAGELCTSACRVCTACTSLYSAVMWRLLVTHPIPPVSPSLLLPCVTVCPHISNAVYKRNYSTCTNSDKCESNVWHYIGKVSL
jgi:hypothetical protein